MRQLCRLGFCASLFVVLLPWRGSYWVRGVRLVAFVRVVGSVMGAVVLNIG